MLVCMFFFWVCLFVFLSVSLSVHLPVCLSVCLPVPWPLLALPASAFEPSSGFLCPLFIVSLLILYSFLFFSFHCVISLLSIYQHYFPFTLFVMSLISVSLFCFPCPSFVSHLSDLFPLSLPYSFYTRIPSSHSLFLPPLFLLLYCAFQCMLSLLISSPLALPRPFSYYCIPV